jgi:hypothetical protein
MWDGEPDWQQASDWTKLHSAVVSAGAAAKTS